MRTIQTLGLAILLSAPLMAQRHDDNTIQIHVVKNINGAETIIDTVITDVNLDFVKIQPIEIEIEMDSVINTNNIEKEMMVLDMELKNLDDSIFLFTIPAIDSILQKHRINPDERSSGTRVIIINDDKVIQDNVRGDVRTSSVRVMFTTSELEALTEDDKKVIRTTDRNYNEKLKIEKAELYPNPNNGRFRLEFTLEEPGNTDVNIFNPEGKNVYTERLNEISGSYSGEIDISNQPPGIYYIRVNQGKRSWYKKIVLQ